MNTKSSIQTAYNAMQHISASWPEKSFTHAPWSDIAPRMKEIYLHLKEMEQPLPGSVCAGYETIETHLGKIAIPHLFPWMGQKGLNIVDHDEDDSVYACLIMSAMLLRIQLQAAPGSLLIHQVDPRRMGADMKALPLNPAAPRLSQEELMRLLRDLEKEMAQHGGSAWRCDTIRDPHSADHRPIHIIAIANWDDLSKKRNDGETEESECQKTILRMLETDVAARNGVYFFICSDDEISDGAMAVIEAEDESHITMEACRADKEGFAEVEKAIDLDVTLPTDEEIAQIHDGYRRFESGALEDEDGKGIWLGNSAKGLRAIMGTTPQGEAQFFELGLGKANNAFHALVGGATGSGKSVLLNEIICSLAERYSPEELRFALLDYKEGTEFAPYVNLPHVFALSIGPNPEFGVETLKHLQKEMERRGQLFKQAGVNNITDYRRVTGEKMCRFVLVADEFQVLCTDKKFGDEARALLNDLVRRARSFGVNFILATQTLRDGSLEGEAKNQFACRICLQLAENETNYFLSTDNSEPAHFNRKGQALLNYSMGMRSGNIFFQSGNRKMPNKLFRTTEDIKRCLAELTQKAKAENMMPADRFLYEGDGFAELTRDMVKPEKGMLMGLSNNMTGAPFYINKRLISGGVLIIGEVPAKKQMLLNLVAAQTPSLFGMPCPVHTPSAYLDGEGSYPLTIFDAPVGDLDLEDALLAWKEDREAAQNTAPAATVDPTPAAGSPLDTSTFQAPAGMEDEFAALAASLQSNFAAAQPTATADPAPARTSRRRAAREMPLVLALSGQADVRMMEASGMSQRDFRVVIYLDMLSYNQCSGNYESGALPESQMFVECPAGVVNKIRIGTLA